MRIDKLLCVGGLCEGFFFTEIFDKRIKGPVDNIPAKNFKSILNLFNGKLFNDILTDNITKEEFNNYRRFSSSDEQFLKTHDDFKLRYYDNWRSGHINFTLLKRKEQFKERIEIFNKFNQDVQNGVSNLYYLYTISEYENTLTKEDFDFTCKNLPKYVIDKLIILGAKRNPIPQRFLNKFRCITYNFDFKEWNTNGNDLFKQEWK